jgi:hypothetical protein
MVIHNFNAVDFPFFPHKANTPLVIDAYASLSRPVAFQDFQIVAGRIFQVIQRLCSIQLTQFAQSPVLHISRKVTGLFAPPNPFRFFTLK